MQQQTSLDNIQIKNTNRGPAVFTSLKKEISNEFGPTLTEQRNLVYLLENPRPTKVIKRNLSPDFQSIFRPTTIDLFRFSALTYNSHMIHYDLNYAQNEEGYSNVLVHG